MEGRFSMYLFSEIATVCIIGLSIALLLQFRARKISWRWPLTTAFAAFAAYKAFDLLRVAFDHVRQPPLWDFRAFYMFGRVAASHKNVYDPASYQIYGPILNPTNDLEFNTIALNIGLPYPPPVALLVYPLGLFDNISVAMTVWYVAIFGAIAASIFLLWRLFFAAEGRAGLIVVAGFVLAMSATAMNVGLAQVTFFVLVLLLGFWRERTPWRAGLWLAPLIFLRPLFIVLALYFIVRRQWSALVSLVTSSAALLALSIPVLGPNGLASYIFNNPVHRYPGSYFMGTDCLYKLLATFTHDESYFSLATHPVYDVLAALTILAAACICALRAKQQRDMCLGLLLAVGLWVYPSTDPYYCVLLLVPMCALWRDRERLALAPATVVVFFTLQFLLLNLRYGAYTAGIAIALDCLIFGYLALRPTVRRATIGRTARFAHVFIRPTFPT